MSGVSLPPENFDGLGVTARKISGSPPHCRPQRLAPLPKSGVSGQKLNRVWLVVGSATKFLPIDLAAAARGRYRLVMEHIRRALLSVSDKTGLVPLAQALAAAGVEMISTGGTAKALREAGLNATDLSAYTGFPEMLDGRVKTLHPKVHGGLLYLRGNAKHEAAVRAHGIDPIDLVVVNLYPFEQTVARADASLEEAIENIDIGGPSMLRSAASKGPRYRCSRLPPPGWHPPARLFVRTDRGSPLPGRSDQCHVCELPPRAWRCREGRAARREPWGGASSHDRPAFPENRYKLSGQ